MLSIPKSGFLRGCAVFRFSYECSGTSCAVIGYNWRDCSYHFSHSKNIKYRDSIEQPAV
jgi:hypothetical protein